MLSLAFPLSLINVSRPLTHCTNPYSKKGGSYTLSGMIHILPLLLYLDKSEFRIYNEFRISDTDVIAKEAFILFFHNTSICTLNSFLEYSF